MGANIHKLPPKIKWQQLFLGMRPQREREREENANFRKSFYTNDDNFPKSSTNLIIVGTLTPRRYIHVEYIEYI